MAAVGGKAADSVPLVLYMAGFICPSVCIIQVCLFHQLCVLAYILSRDNSVEFTRDPLIPSQLLDPRKSAVKRIDRMD